MEPVQDILKQVHISCLARMLQYRFSAALQKTSPDFELPWGCVDKDLKIKDLNHFWVNCSFKVAY